LSAATVQCGCRQEQWLLLLNNYMLDYCMEPGFAATVRPLASTLFTPLTFIATRTACFFCAELPTVPLRVTTLSTVLTEMSVAGMFLVVPNSDFTLVVIHASAALSGTV
jgi:hypothetical protein